MSIKPNTKTHMPTMDAKERARAFSEVNQGYPFAHASFEALRCLRCQDPTCEAGCPVNIPIKEFISLLAENKLKEALLLVKKFNSLPAVCGRVCPQESQCEMKCGVNRGGKFKPVAIGHLERFIADWEIQNGRIDEELPPKRKERVAIVGSGPAGLTAAGDLIRKGYHVTVFEALHEAGGVLRYGIPEFRLPKHILDFEIEGLTRLGVEIVCNFVVGRTKTVDELLEEYDALFLGTGAGLPSFLKIEGETLNGVYSSNEFLTRINLMKGYLFPNYDTPVKAGKKAVVVGSGNVAMDSVRSAMRMGADEVTIVYRRTIKEMTARIEEYEHAIEEGVNFKWLTNPVRIIGDENGWVKAMEVEKMKLGEPDASGRARPVPTGEKFIIETDCVVVAIGTSPNPLIAQTTPDIKTEKWGGIIINETTQATSKAKVFAGGDVVTGSATVILAAGAGRNAAGAIHATLSKKGANGSKSAKRKKK
ncbi:NADPH-dependent glutamate synthase [Elusimicrobiota bacterium]